MAWNSGNLTFTMTWKSLKGRTCLVRIYVRGSQIQNPLSLTAGAQPFTYDDDADSDLLNNVVRYKTGYLRVIETAQQDLSYLYPTDDFLALCGVLLWWHAQLRGFPTGARLRQRARSIPKRA